MKRGRLSWLWYLLVYLAFFGFVEAAFRLFTSPVDTGAITPRIFGRGHDAGFLVEPDKDLGYVIKRPASADVFLDSLGRPFDRKKPKGTLRIICLGGSTTYGVGSEGRHGYPVLLENYLNAMLAPCQGRVEVLNCGVMGYHSWHSLARAELELDALNPDLYLVMDAVNDLATAALASDVRELSREKELLTGLVARPVHGPALIVAEADRFLGRSRAYSAVKAWLTDLLRRRGAARIEEKLEAFGYADNMVRLIMGRRERGIEVAVLNYPWIVRGGEAPETEAQRLPYAVDAPLYLAGRRFFAATNASLAEKTRSLVVDLQPVMDVLTDGAANVCRFYTDNVHLSRLSNLVIARHVAQILAGSAWFGARFSDCRPEAPERVDPLFASLFSWGENVAAYGWITDMERAVEQRLIAARGVLEKKEAHEGWSVYHLDGSQETAVLEFQVERGCCGPTPTRGFDLVFYPRITDNPGDAVEVDALTPNGGRYPLLRLDALDETNVPVAQQYGLRLPEDPPGPVRLEVRLTGDAQIWSRDGRFFFR